MELNEFKNKVLPLKNSIFRLTKRIIGNREDAEEITQETLIRIWQKGESNLEEARFASFAIKIARNLCLDKMRSKHHKLKAVNIEDIAYNLIDTAPRADSEIEKLDAKELIESILAGFPENMRSVVHLRDIEGYSNQETAEMLDIDYQNVKVILSRGRKKLREILINKYDYR